MSATSLSIHVEVAHSGAPLRSPVTPVPRTPTSPSVSKEVIITPPSSPSTSPPPPPPPSHPESEATSPLKTLLMELDRLAKDPHNGTTKADHTGKGSDNTWTVWEKGTGFGGVEEDSGSMAETNVWLDAARKRKKDEEDQFKAIGKTLRAICACPDFVDPLHASTVASSRLVPTLALVLRGVPFPAHTTTHEALEAALECLRILLNSPERAQGDLLEVKPAVMELGKKADVYVQVEKDTPDSQSLAVAKAALELVAMFSSADAVPGSVSQGEEYVKALTSVQFGQATFQTHCNESTTTRPQRGWMSRVAKEMALLSTSLPLHPESSIFVRTHEARMDLLKAVIVGPSGTPYANGLFEFDIKIPSTYPNVPPEVIFCTTGGGTVNFNPNLYADGMVCLSLLGTWDGPGWCTQTSTILQVLVSLQSLVLVAQPYYNEPGYEQQEEDGLSEDYNRNVRTGTILHALLGQIKHPPQGFEEVSKIHFTHASAAILKQLDDWKGKHDAPDGTVQELRQLLTA